MVEKIKRINLREAWRHEAKDFTTWLEDNIDVLNDVIDITLSGAEKEKSAGTFNVDLVAEDINGDLVVIENQLEKSDHDHLGKLITYLTSVGAKAAIWIVADPRPEHVNAVTWLNESSAASFYIIKLEAVKIQDSEPAPLLTLIVGPSEEGREVGKTKKDLAERHILRKKWWTMLLENAKNKTKLHNNVTPGIYNWIGASAGKRGLGYNYAVTKHGCQAELYIDCGKDSKEKNEAIFEDLAKNKDSIEKEFGGPLSWEKLELKRACRIVKRNNKGGYRDKEENWPEIQDELIDSMIRMEKSLKPFIKKLKIEK
jgi:hypothetical protein